MFKLLLKSLSAISCLIAGLALGLCVAEAGELPFSAPKHLATISWSNGSNHGVCPGGAEWLVVDDRGRYWLESDLDFRIYSPNGRYLRTVNPFDKKMNFYGFAAMETLPDDRIVLLERMETQAEQRQKLNYENRSQPGVRLVVLKSDGTVEMDKTEVDPRQPHSDYYAEMGNIYGIHDDGTYQLLDSVGSFPKDRKFDNFAAVDDPRRWLDHIKTLSIFSCENGYFHDISGRIHAYKDGKSFLLGHPFIEGTGPLAERDGIIYYRVICYPNGKFTHSVFIEDSIRKTYVLLNLVTADDDLEAAHDHALFVDQTGNLFEGVAKKDGYRIYEWESFIKPVRKM